MIAVSVKLPPDLHAELSREARRRNVSRSTLVRELIANALNSGTAKSPSCADLAGELVGTVRSGHPDMATNPQLLDEAVVQDSHRARADGHR